VNSAFLAYFEIESAHRIFLAYKISLAMGIYCNIIITHIAIEVIHKSVTFSENNNNTMDNSEIEVPLRKTSLNPSMQQLAMSEVSRSQSVAPYQRSLTEM
jgi:hypothetical protein